MYYKFTIIPPVDGEVIQLSCSDVCELVGEPHIEFEAKCFYYDSFKKNYYVKSINLTRL